MIASKLASISFNGLKSTRQSFLRPNLNVMKMSSAGTIVYTETDEAPMLATYSLLPIIKKFCEKADINVVKSDISLAGRIISQFPKYLKEEERIPDNLAALGELCKSPEANIIKLPNISASLPQLNDAIKELRLKGYDIPLYVTDPKTDKEKVIHSRYAKVLGSAVNPVLREGNSDRRVALPVKRYAQKNPHHMGSWSRASRSHVAHMKKGDFYGTEKSYITAEDCACRIEFVSDSEGVKVMKDNIKLQSGEVIDASFLSVKELRKFFEEEIQEAYNDHLLLSIHMKATMMKVSDPVIFGHMVSVYYKQVFEKHGAIFKSLGVNPNNGIQDVFEKIKLLPEVTRSEILSDIELCYEERPWLAMVDSSKGITNLHAPNDIIVDASMPVVIRDSGKMWNRDGELEDTKCVIPDRCYATMYQEIISFVKANGQFDSATMGSVSNVGLMAQKAEEYGSHDKTFVVSGNGTMRVINSHTNSTIFEHKVENGDIWRMCQTKDAPIKDWVRLAVQRSRLTNTPAVFWLGQYNRYVVYAAHAVQYSDDHRAHDRNIIQKVQTYLKDHDTNGLDITIQSPVHAMLFTCERAKEGLDTISVTGNVLRDYLTDLFPILELGTSAKMLSIVPLLAGGGLFETGAGGSAPKHVQQFVKEGHLRWDSLGEYLAVAVSLEHLGQTKNNAKAMMLSTNLNKAIERALDHKKSPSRRVNELDNRAANFYIALYWAEFCARDDPSFAELAKKLQENRTKIVQELKASQGRHVDLGGYYRVDPVKAELAMRPSPTFNQILDSV